MKKKICMIVPSLGGGGAERVAFHLLNNLNLKKYELTLIETQEEGNYLEELNKNIKLKCLYRKRFRKAVFLLFLELYCYNPDIIITFSKEIAIFCCFLKKFFLLKNTKLIIREVNIQSKLNKSIIKKMLMKFFYKNADVIISQSKDMTNDILNYSKVSEEKIIEINNPVDMLYVEKKLKNKYIIFDKNYYNLVCVGRLEYQKGFDLIIKIMARLKKEKIKLYILGEGKEKERLEKLIKSLKLEESVYLLGKKKNPYIYMENADLFILSSRFEGFPNVLLEANACGIYAICNNSLGGINQIIENDINGCILDFSNEELVAEKIKIELNKKRDREEIKEIILQKYGISQIIQKYENLF